MAMNWDKLSKLRRDYHKPKIAFNEVTRQLKKKPKDQYLLAWHADISLQTESRAPETICLNLGQLLDRQPPITDTRLLSYIYRLYVETFRRATQNPETTSSMRVSAGELGVKAWQNAARSLSDRRAKLELWSTFFVTAMGEDCWDDVRVALRQALQDGLKSRKKANFALVFANQLSFEMQQRIADAQGKPLSMSATLQGALAYKTMKTAFESVADSTKDQVQVQELRDLQFMAQIFARQARYVELFTLWDNPPERLETIMKTYHSDLNLLRVTLLKNPEAPGLESNLCIKAIRDSPQDSVDRWVFWKRLLQDSEDKANTPESIKQLRKDILPDLNSEGRPARLIDMAVTAYCGGDLLSLCKSYWLQHRHQRACYYDLRGFIERLGLHEQEEFHNYISGTTKTLMDQTDGDGKMLKTWFQAECNVLKFDYWYTFSLSKQREVDVLEAFFCNAIRLLRIGTFFEDDCIYDIRSLAIICIKHLAPVVHGEKPSNVPNGSVDNNCLELQATFLSRYLIEGDIEKQDRSLIMLSIMMHVMLGFVSIAFDKYQYVRVKEILHDTVSYALLSRISLIHPMDTSGPIQVRPDEELARVIKTIERMESRTDDFLYKDMNDFQYDQAFELLEFKGKLRSSLTKHLCVVERRRIARLKGEPWDDSLDLDLRTFMNISDNRDFDIFPRFEDSRDDATHNDKAGLVPRPYPNEAWLSTFYFDQDIACSLLYKETDYAKSKRRNAQLLDHFAETFYTNWTQSENHFYRAWCTLKNAAGHLCDITDLPNAEIAEALDTLLKEINQQKATIEGFGDIPLKAVEPENVKLPRESVFHYWFGLLEVLQASHRVIELAEEQLKKKNSPLKRKLKEQTIQNIREATQFSYDTLRSYVQKWIDLIEGRGREIMKAQARWGPTGKALADMLQDNYLDRYVIEARASLLDTLRGVLKVKLKR